MNIDDYLPKNIIIKHGNLSETFYRTKLYYDESIDMPFDFFLKFFYDIVLNMNPYKNKFDTILVQEHQLYKVLYFAVNNWQTDKYYRNILQISSTSYRIKLDKHTKLLILYSFLDNQFFPTANKVLENQFDKMMNAINFNIKNYYELQKNMEPFQFTKDDFKIFTTRALSAFYMNCISEHLCELYQININVFHIDSYMKEFLSPYISLCKSKYIRINDDYMNFLYNESAYLLNTDSIHKFLKGYTSIVFYTPSKMNTVWTPIKKYLFKLFNANKSSLKDYWNIEGKWISNISTMLTNSELIYLFDYHTNLAILHLFEKDLNNVSKLRYILFYYNNIKRYTYVEHIFETFITNLIIKYNLTDINSYGLDKNDSKVIKEHLYKLNEIISRTMLEELK